MAGLSLKDYKCKFSTVSFLVLIVIVFFFVIFSWFHEEWVVFLGLQYKLTLYELFKQHISIFLNLLIAKLSASVTA